MKKISLSLMLLIQLITLKSAFAQDPEFTQFYANPLYLNPALTGSNICTRVTLNYRNQWPAISGTYVTSAASFDRFVHSIKSGIGVLAMNDRAGNGTLTTTNISLFYSKQVPLRKNAFVNFGMRAGYGQKKIDWSKLNFGDMIDPKHGFVYNTADAPGLAQKSFADFSAGTFLSIKNFYAGFAVDHLTEPDEGLKGSSPLPRKYTAHAGATIPLKKKEKNGNSISPNILYQKQQDFEQLNLGMYVNSGPLVGGLWYRHAYRAPDAFVLLLGVQHGYFKIGYSYDITISRLTNVTAGSHELSFGIQLNCKKPNKKIRPSLCPSF